MAVWQRKRKCDTSFGLKKIIAYKCDEITSYPPNILQKCNVASNIYLLATALDFYSHAAPYETMMPL